MSIGRSTEAGAGAGAGTGGTHRGAGRGPKAVVYITARVLAASKMARYARARDFSRIMAMDRFSSTTSTPHKLYGLRGITTWITINRFFFVIWRS